MSSVVVNIFPFFLFSFVFFLFLTNLSYSVVCVCVCVFFVVDASTFSLVYVFYWCLFCLKFFWLILLCTHKGSTRGTCSLFNVNHHPTLQFTHCATGTFEWILIGKYGKNELESHLVALFASIHCDQTWNQYNWVWIISRNRFSLIEYWLVVSHAIQFTACASHLFFSPRPCFPISRTISLFALAILFSFSVGFGQWQLIDWQLVGSIWWQHSIDARNSIDGIRRNNNVNNNNKNLTCHNIAEKMKKN